MSGGVASAASAVWFRRAAADKRTRLDNFRSVTAGLGYGIVFPSLCITSQISESLLVEDKFFHFGFHFESPRGWCFTSARVLMS